MTHRSNYLQDSVVTNLPSGPSLGIGITPDLATGPTNIYFDTGFQFGPSENGPTRFVENTFSWTDAVSWTQGKHNWKFGAGFSPYQENLVYDYYTNGEFDFYSSAVLPLPQESLCRLSNGSRVCLFSGTACRFQHSQQEHLCVRPGRMAHTQKPGADTGLRYEYNTPKSDTQGRSFSMIPGLQSQRFPERASWDGVPWRSRRPNRGELPRQEKFRSTFRLCSGIQPEAARPASAAASEFSTTS